MFHFKGKRVLVTGAAGFIGANLVRALVNHEAQVHSIVRRGTSFVRIAEVAPRLHLHFLDLEDFLLLKKTVDEIRPQIIFHLAVSGAHPGTTEERLHALRSNVLGTSHLLEAVLPHEFESFVYTASSLEYGPKSKALEEADLLEPSTIRGVTKAAATLLCQQFARSYRRPLVILRLFSVFGYWESSSRLIPTAIRSALEGREILLTSPGYRRDFVFIEDVVEACLQATQAEGLKGEIINIGTGRQWSNEEVIEKIQAITNRPLSVRIGDYPPRLSDATHWVADIRKAETLLDWRPRHSLQSGLEKEVAWFRDPPRDYA